MKKIYKYKLKMEFDNQVVVMPVGARIVHVEAQHGVPCMWAEVDVDAQINKRQFLIVNTGFVIPNGYRYVGTFMLLGGDYVGHIYENEMI